VDVIKAMMGQKPHTNAKTGKRQDMKEGNTTGPFKSLDKTARIARSGAWPVQRA